jgi:hypothetical protein
MKTVEIFVTEDEMCVEITTLCSELVMNKCTWHGSSSGKCKVFTQQRPHSLSVGETTLGSY